MKYMQCITCKNTVQMNDTSICLQCQGRHGTPQKDIWQKKPVRLCDVIDEDETNYDKLMRDPNIEE